MVSSKATTVQQYLSELPDERRAAIAKVRKVIRANLPPGFREEMQYGMIGYNVPLTRYPKTYNAQPLGLAALAAQKNYLSLYLLGIYGDPAFAAWFEQEFRRSGKKLDKGKSCVRFKSPDDLPLELIGEAIGRLSVDAVIALYEASRTIKPHRARSVSKPSAAARARGV